MFGLFLMSGPVSYCSGMVALNVRKSTSARRGRQSRWNRRHFEDLFDFATWESQHFMYTSWWFYIFYNSPYWGTAVPVKLYTHLRWVGSDQLQLMGVAVKGWTTAVDTKCLNVYILSWTHTSPLSLNLSKLDVTSSTAAGRLGSSGSSLDSCAKTSFEQAGTKKKQQKTAAMFGGLLF